MPEKESAARRRRGFRGLARRSPSEVRAPADKRHGGAPKGERAFRVKRNVRAAPHPRGSLAPMRRDKDKKMRLSALRPPLGSVGSKTKA
jgi:hypothetical protein